MPGSVSLIHMNALLRSDYAILTYNLHFFALCRGPKGGGAWHNAPPKYAPGCACINGHNHRWAQVRMAVQYGTFRI